MQPNGQHYAGSLMGSRKDTFEVRPEGDDGPVYHLRIPTVEDRATFNVAVGRAVRRAVGGDGPQRRGESYLLDELEAAVRRFQPADEDDGEVAADIETWLRLIAEQRERMDAFDREAFGEGGWWQDATPEERSRRRQEAVALPEPLQVASMLAEENDERYARAVDADALWHEMAAAQAARQFLVRWDGIDLPGRKPSKIGKRRVEEETLVAIPIAHLGAIYVAALERLAPGAARLKNSSPPSSGDSSGTTPSSERSTSPPSDPAPMTTECSTGTATDSPGSS